MIETKTKSTVYPVSDDDLSHFCCETCDPELETSLCGFDVRDVPVGIDPEDMVCRVCDELNFCPYCGEEF